MGHLIPESSDKGERPEDNDSIQHIQTTNLAQMFNEESEVTFRSKKVSFTRIQDVRSGLLSRGCAKFSNLWLFWAGYTNQQKCNLNLVDMPVATLGMDAEMNAFPLWKWHSKQRSYNSVRSYSSALLPLAGPRSQGVSWKRFFFSYWLPKIFFFLTSKCWRLNLGPKVSRCWVTVSLQKEVSLNQLK